MNHRLGIVIIGLLVCVACGGMISHINRYFNVQPDIMKQYEKVPLGITPSMMTTYFEWYQFEGSSVINLKGLTHENWKFELSSEGQDIRLFEPHKSKVRSEKVGTYYKFDWRDSKWKAFTGNIIIFDHTRFTGYALWFTFLNGKLVKKDYGYLPG